MTTTHCKISVRRNRLQSTGGLLSSGISDREFVFEKSPPARYDWSSPEPVPIVNVILNTDLPGLALYAKGKVRDVYRIEDRLLFVATDRISAFDCILPTGIPDKGKVLTQLSVFWFEFLRDIVPTHFITSQADEFPPSVWAFRDQLEGRSMLVKRAVVTVGAGTSITGLGLSAFPK